MYGDIWQKEDYLNWLYERLLAIKEVMSDTASIYVHLDWHIGHYVKVLMDEVFGEENFLNDIIWGYKTGGIPETGKFAKKHDLIFLYKKGESNVFNDLYQKSYVATVPEPHTESGKRLGVKRDETCDICGNSPGQKYREVQMRDVWDDISSIFRNDDQVQDYATQKPEALLERIIKASSNEGMVVADFFGGSGVTAKVAHDLGRRFITADVGINAIQTMRDRLVDAGASFDILKIKDGIDLFRNPQQTMDKLATIIPGLTTTHDFGSFWFGAITDKGTVCPCWIPNLKDKGQAILNPALFSKIMDETAKLDGISKAVVCSVDITGEDEIKKMMKDYDLRDADGKPVQFVFKDLKELIDLIVSPDVVEYTIKEKSGKHVITFDRFISDALIQKVVEFNAKKKAKQKAIQISDEGLELVEFISVDCTNADGVWVSNHEIKIDKNGYMIVNGERTKQFWDGTVTVSKKPLRIKVRNIAGDEVVVVTE